MTADDVIKNMMNLVVYDNTPDHGRGPGVGGIFEVHAFRQLRWRHGEVAAAHNEVRAKIEEELRKKLGVPKLDPEADYEVRIMCRNCTSYGLTATKKGKRTTGESLKEIECEYCGCKGMMEPKGATGGIDDE